jgi:hypothetical protein
MSRTRQAIPGLSLFPFLAVLLSTMGILVLLLFLSIRMAARSAELERNRAPAAEVVAELQQLEAESSLANIRLAGWEEVRQRLNERLQNSRIRQNSLLEQLDELKAELLDMERQAAAVQPESRAGHAAELESLQREAESLRAAIAGAAAKPDADPAGSQQAAVMYNLVPTQSPGGTMRRPIYVECTGSAVVLQPLGIHLNAEDFVEPDVPGNPLDAALGEIRDYWLRNDVAGEAGRPYPLLVVRPEGASAWSASRRAMQGWSDEFGYELVADDLTLDFGPTDPVLAERVKAVIDRARTTMAVYHRQRETERQLAESARKSQQSALVSGMKASRTGGGFVNSGGSPMARGQTDAQSMGQAGAIAQVEPFTASPRVASTDQQSGSGDPSAGKLAAENSGTGGETAGGTAAGDAAGATGATGVTGTASGSANSAEDTAGACPCLADQRGGDWALQKNARQSTGYLRPIAAWCDADSLRLEPGALSWLPSESVSLETSPDQIGDEVATAIRRIVDGWGSPPENGYWKPQLRVRVLPGGGPRLEALRQLLRNSGIELGETPAS